MNQITRRESSKITLLGMSSLAASSILPHSSPAQQETPEVKPEYDALIIGGGPAGLSAALAMGRIVRTALVCDDSRPRNAPSEHLNNFPTRDGIHPEKWRQEARQNLEKYQTIDFFDGSVLSVSKDGEARFTAELSSGTKASFKKVILADGIEDKLPAIPGFKELWGKAIFHCPYCHGFEVRDTALGVVANGDAAMHLVPLLYALSKDLVLFTHGKAELNQQQKEVLQRMNIPLIEQPIQRLAFGGDTLEAVVLEDGRQIARRSLFAAPILPFQTKSALGEQLGCEKTEAGLYKVSERNETSVKGVFAAGDNMTRLQSVLHACGHGLMAGAGVVFDVLHESMGA